MAIMAEWKGKRWEVSPKRILALEGLSTSYKLKKQNQSDDTGTPSTNTVGTELQPLSFTTTLSDSVGVDVRAEIESWGALVGQSGPFLLGGRRFGPALMQLIEVNVSNVIIDDFGRIRVATLGLKFEEDAGNSVAEKTKSKSSSTKNKSKLSISPGIQPSNATYAELFGPTTADKMAKKPVNPQMTWSGVKT